MLTNTMPYNSGQHHRPKIDLINCFVPFQLIVYTSTSICVPSSFKVRTDDDEDVVTRKKIWRGFAYLFKPVLFLFSHLFRTFRQANWSQELISDF